MLASGLALAFANGANDNFKGVATVYGAGQLTYRRALGVATAAQLAGSLASVVIAGALVTAFSGKGLVPPALLTPELLASVAGGAALTVGIATWFGLPISTTHAIVGALVGAGAIAAGAALQLGGLATVFLLPLALGPLVALVLAAALARLGSGLGLTGRECVCIVEPSLAAAQGGMALTNTSLRIAIADANECALHRADGLPGIELDRGLRIGHLLSASSVGLARGINDTPKILGLMVGASVIHPGWGALAVGGAMAIGGLFGARRVADTLAQKITPIDDGHGLAANLATSFLVIGASRLGMPVSTTHVSTGGIFGIGAAGGTLHRRATVEILLAWIATLPSAALLGALLAACLT